MLEAEEVTHRTCRVEDRITVGHHEHARDLVARPAGSFAVVEVDKRSANSLDARESVCGVDADAGRAVGHSAEHRNVGHDKVSRHGVDKRPDGRASARRGSAAWRGDACLERMHASAKSVAEGLERGEVRVGGILWVGLGGSNGGGGGVGALNLSRIRTGS